MYALYCILASFSSVNNPSLGLNALMSFVVKYKKYIS